MKNYKILIPIFSIILFTFEVYRFDLFGLIIRPSDLFIFLIALPTLFYVLAGAKFQIDNVVVLILIYIVACLIPSIINPQIVSFVGISYSILILFAYMLTIASVKTHNDINILINTIIILTSLIGVYIIAEQFLFTYYGIKFSPPLCDYLRLDCVNSTYGFNGGMMRPRGFFISYNGFGSFAIVGFFLAYFRAKFNSSYFYYGLSLFISLSILASLSRNAILGLVIGIIISQISISIIKAKSVINLFKTIMLSIIFLIIGILLIDFISNFYSNIQRFNIFYYFDEISRYSDFMGVSYTITSKGDTDFSIFISHILAALEANSETFGMGVGVQLFDEYAIKYDYVNTWGSHSNFIIFLGESGIFGFASQVLIVIYLFSMLLKVIKWSSSKFKSVKRIDYYSLLFICLFSAYLSIVVSGIIRTFYYNIYTFIVVALLVIIYRKIKSSNNLLISIS